MRLLTSTAALLLPVLIKAHIAGVDSSDSTSTSNSNNLAPAKVPASTTPSPSQTPPTAILEINIDLWSPISTLTTLPSVPTHTQESQQTKDTTEEEPEPNLELRVRQAATVAPAAPPAPSQISPITTLLVGEMVNGVYQQVQVVYTQLFSAVPDQGELPASGSIGLGTIQGNVGIVRTNEKRDLGLEPEPTASVSVPGGVVIEILEAEVPVAMPVKIELVEADGETERADLRMRAAGNAISDEEESAPAPRLQRKSSQNFGPKAVEASTAGSVLALLVAIGVMIVA